MGRALRLLVVCVVGLLGSCHYPIATVDHHVRVTPEAAQSFWEAALELEKETEISGWEWVVCEAGDGYRIVDVLQLAQRVLISCEDHIVLSNIWFNCCPPRRGDVAAAEEFQLDVYRFFRQRVPSLPPVESLQRLTWVTDDPGNEFPPRYPWEQRGDSDKR